MLSRLSQYSKPYLWPLEYVKTFFWALWFTFPYLVVAVATAIVLGYFDQTRELYRAYAQAPSEHIGHIVLLYLALSILTYVVWLVVRDTLQHNPDRSSFLRPGYEWTARGFAVGIALLIPAGATLGMITAAGADPVHWFVDKPEMPQFGKLIDARSSLEGLAYKVAVCAAAFAILALFWGDRVAYAPLARLARFRRVPTGFALFTLISLLIYLWPLDVSRFLGAVAIVLLFSLCLTVFIRFFYNFSPYLNAAFLLLVVAYVFVLSQLERNDYKVVPEVVTAQSAAAPEGLSEADAKIRAKGMLRAGKHGEMIAPSTEQAFEAWLNGRADKDKFAGPNKLPYPVFLVAASGGGLYSARHTAMTLARIQDKCPKFAQHIFAISGISGGSWGSAVFHSLAREHAGNAENLDCSLAGFQIIPRVATRARDTQDRAMQMLSGGPGPFEERVRKFMNEDFLSPLIGVGLFPNMFQLVLPWSAERLNRSAIFERVIAESLGRPGKGPLRDTVNAAWDPNKSGGALILNMTDADRGYQVAAAPFTIRANRRQDEQAFMLVQKFLNEMPKPPEPAQALAGSLGGAQAAADEEKPRRTTWEDLRINSAVAMSAGFPAVIGAGNLKNKVTEETRRLVDGGYYENSGVESLLQIIDQLREREQKLEISIHVLVLDSRYPPGEQDTLLSPLKAILATRSVRSQIAITNLYTNRSLTNDILKQLCDLSPDRTLPCDITNPSLKDEESAECRELDREAGRMPGSSDEGDDGDSPASANESGKLRAPFDRRFERLRPAQLSLDLETFAVPLAFYLSTNAKAVIDGSSRLGICSIGGVIKPRSAESSAREQHEVKEMENRLKCAADTLCNSFKLLAPPRISDR
jgi:hypothetical protein